MANQNNIIKTVTLLFFLVFATEVLAEYFSYVPMILVTKPLIPLMLIVLYFFESDKKDWVYIVMMFLSLVTNLLFIPNTAEMLFYGLIVFMIHRIFVILLILKLNKIIDFIPVIIAVAPFLIIFFYIFFQTPDLPKGTMPLVISHNILMSVFAGISLSNYVMNDNKQNSILMISAMLFVILQLSVFIERYYLYDEYSQVLRPLSMSLNGLAFYTFYRYVIEAEKSNNN